MAVIPLKLFLFVAIALAQFPTSIGKPSTHTTTYIPTTWWPHMAGSKSSQFYLDLYQWLLTSKYEILSRDNVFASRDHVFLFLVPRLGLQASGMLARNCMTNATTYQESALQFGICALVVLDELFQKKSIQ